MRIHLMHITGMFINIKREENLKYSTLLFDLDGTLLDFDAYEQIALEKLFSTNYVSLTSEIRDTYDLVNKNLWLQYEKGLVPLDKVLNLRFSEALKIHGYSVDGNEWERMYREYLAEGYSLLMARWRFVKNYRQSKG